MAVQIQLRNDTAANWTSANPTLAAGEVGVETDTEKMKLGDGTTAWNSLGYLAPTTHASTHESGGSDEIEIAQSQVTGLDTGTEGYTALSNGSSGLSYQPISHNYVINGAFDIWQRGTSFSGGAGRFYSADRFTIGGPSDYTFTRNTDAPSGIIYSLKSQRDESATATGVNAISHNLETAGYELSSQEITVSFYAKEGAGFTGTLSGRVFTSSDAWSAIAFSGVGSIGFGNADFEEINIGAFSTDTSWQRFSATLTVPSTTNAMQVQLRWAGSGTAGADDSIYITGVQLEAGSIATPFKRNANSIAGELQACQRYYQRVAKDDAFDLPFIFGTTITSNSSRFLINTLVEMRATPQFQDLNPGDLSVFYNDGGVTVSSFTEVKKIGAAVRVHASHGGVSPPKIVSLVGNTGYELDAEL